MFTFFLLALTGAAFAAPASSSAPVTVTPAASSSDNSQARIGAAELQCFAAAYGDVSKIRRNLMIETRGLTNADKIAAMKKRAEGKMKAAILRHLTLGEYVRIAKAVNADPALHAHFMEIRRSEREALVPAPASG